jgi:long-chain acyl-CoA synthetase
MEVWAERNGMMGRSYADLVTSEPVRQMVDEYVSRLNSKLNRWETIKRFVILDHDLTVESGELTPSLKVKRKVVEQNNRSILDSLYE